MNEENKTELSDCCSAPVRVECGDDFGKKDGTCHYECTKCGKSCDIKTEEKEERKCKHGCMVHDCEPFCRFYKCKEPETKEPNITWRPKTGEVKFHTVPKEHKEGCSVSWDIITGKQEDCICPQEPEGWEEEFAKYNFDPIIHSKGRMYFKAEQVKSFITQLLESEKAKAYEEGKRSMAITVDKNFAEFLKTLEGHKLLEQARQEGYEARKKEEYQGEQEAGYCEIHSIGNGPACRNPDVCKAILKERERLIELARGMKKPIVDKRGIVITSDFIRRDIQEYNSALEDFIKEANK